MDQVDLQAFEVLARTLHFKKSAEELNLSPSAFTRRIQGLEDELGQPLLLRDRRVIALTPAGERLLSYCRSQGELLQELVNDLREESRDPSGTLEVACTVTACHSILPELLSRFRQLYPRVSLKLLTQDATRSLAQLNSGEVDLAVIPIDESLSEIQARKLSSTEFALIAPLGTGASCPTGDAALLDSLQRDHSWVAPLGGLDRARLEEWREQHAPQSQISAEVRGNEGIIAMVSLGVGIAWVPELVLENSPLKQKVEVFSLKQRPRGYEIALCASERSLKRRAVRLLFEL